MKGLEDKMIGYMLNQLEKTEVDKFKEHLQRNPSDRQILEEYELLFGELNQIPDEKPSPNLQRKFRETLDRQISQQKEESYERNPLFVYTYWKIFGIAATVIIAALCWHQLVRTSDSDNIDDRMGYQQLVHLKDYDRTSQRINGLYQLQANNGLDPEILKVLEDLLLNDPSINVRLSVVESLSAYLEDLEVKSILINALKTAETPIVQIRIIEVLTGTGQQNIPQEFEKILLQDNLHDAVKGELHVGLRNLYRNI